MSKIDYLAKRDEAVLDTECLPNFWCIGFRQRETGKIVVLRRSPTQELNRERLAKILYNHRVYSYNGLHYDIPMITLALSGASNETLKKANDLLIPPKPLKGMMSWEFYKYFGIEPPPFLDHIDLMPMAPAAAQQFSLKQYAGSMHVENMMEYLHDFNKPVNDEQANHVVEYMGNDLMVTEALAEEMQPQLALRAEISAEYGLDFRSKSDAQCGEAYIKLTVEREKGDRIYRPEIVPGPFNYEPPAYIEFKTPEMQAMLERLRREKFIVRHDGYVQLPPMFKTGKRKKTKSGDVYEDEDDIEQEGQEIRIGGTLYKMGNGGLHSQEKSITHYSTEVFQLCDNDVTSYYPFLMLASGQEPANMKGYFLRLFKKLVLERVAAKARSGICKRNGDEAGAKKWKSRAESLKIFINGLFGKTGSPWSVVYAPKMMIQTTVTGQLSIMMLIEEFELRGWKVVSANTDGFVTLVPWAERGLYRAVIFDWEVRCSLQTEETFYESLHSRDVNNYQALKVDHEIADLSNPKHVEAGYTWGQVIFTGKKEMKLKGAYRPSGRGYPSGEGLKKTPDADICSKAATQFIMHGTRIEETVRNCQDIRDFVRQRRVQGGAEKHGEIIGKVVRYYYGDDDPGPMNYITSGNRVPKSEGSVPCMRLPAELPRNIDHEWYEREAYARLNDMGMEVTDPLLAGRNGHFLGHKEDQKTLHKIDAGNGVALCGAAKKEWRDVWIEHKEVPDGMRYCAKCRKHETI